MLIHLGEKIDSRQKRKEELLSGFWFLKFHFFIIFFMRNRKDSWARKTIGETKMNISLSPPLYFIFANFYLFI